MLVLGSWLKEFVPFDAPYEEVAEALTMAGLEVEGIFNAFPGIREGVLSCLVERIRPIKGSSRLVVARCFDGKEKRTVVCGAPNVREGMIAPLVLPGTELPGGPTIEEREIMGTLSQGMLCSKRELLVGDDASGIWDLSGQGIDRPGVPLGEFYLLDDTVLEVGITPNRADCLSVLGIAREVKSLFGSSLEMESLLESAAKGRGAPSSFPVTIEALESCRRYMGTIIRGVRVGESPSWLKFKLLSVGVRPINNVVDITNYCLFELGQPLHAFDLDFLEGPEIRVRMAQEGETIETLDHKVKRLSGSMLVIADALRPVAVAGVMGGADSEVSDRTKAILLESAWFEPNQVGRTAKALRLSTEASYRFERRVDPEMVPVALRRAADLISKIAGGVIEGEVDVYPLPYEPRTVTFRPERIRMLSGLDVGDAEQVSILEGIGFERVLDEKAADHIAVKVPSFRFDVQEEVDIVEEVARLKGLEAIPTLSPVRDLIPNRLHEPMVELIGELKDALIEQGVFEAISYSFVSMGELVSLGFPEEHKTTRVIKLLNPIAEDQSVMRTSLVPSLLQAVSRNLSRKNVDLRLFEQGRCFFQDPSVPTGAREEEMLMCVFAGKRFPRGWAWSHEDVDVYDVKGVLDYCLRRLRVSGWSVDQSADALPYYSRDCFSSVISEDGSVIGCLGRLSHRCLSFWDIDVPVYALELFLEELVKVQRRPRSMESLPRFPASSRDAAFIVREEVTYEEIMGFIQGRDVEYLEEVYLFDLYRGKPIPKGRKSMAFRFRYRAKDRTLTDDEVSRIHGSLIEGILRRFGAEIRA